MTFISFAEATPADREAALGREFREIEVVGADFSGAAMKVTVILEGQPVVLIGDPIQALTTYLGGMARIETQGAH